MTFVTLKQVDAVVESVKSVLGEGYVAGVAVSLNPEQRASVIAMLCKGLVGGTIQFSPEAKAKHEAKGTIKTYASGLLTNWLNKSPELNGGVKYEIKNPGSRSEPEQLKQARVLKAALEANGKDTTGVDELIAKHEADIAAAKAMKTAKTKELDFSALPPELQALVG